MIKKLLLSIAPVLVLAAFAVMPAMASASLAYGVCEVGTPHAAECPAGEKKFTAFPNGTKEAVLSRKVRGSGNFVLELVEAPKEKIECSSLSDAGTDENVAAVGHSTDYLFFSDCKLATGALAGCNVNSFFADEDNILVIVTNEVKTMNEVEIKLPVGGVELEVPGTQAGCPLTALGSVTGTAKGTQATGSNILKFAASPGLTFGRAATITGETETVTEGTRKKVVIN